MSLTDSFSNKMLKGKLATYNFRQCHQEYKQFRTFYKTDPQEEFQFCVVKLAAGDDNDTVGPCDSAAWGSPLWTNDGVQVGIASQGSCDVDSPPFLYTRVERYVVWIREQICLLSENPPSYCE
jgi:secreted trypsin-like serine protease